MSRTFVSGATGCLAGITVDGIFLHVTWRWDKPGLDTSWKWSVLT